MSHRRSKYRSEYLMNRVVMVKVKRKNYVTCKVNVQIYLENRMIMGKFTRYNIFT